MQAKLHIYNQLSAVLCPMSNNPANDFVSLDQHYNSVIPYIWYQTNSYEKVFHYIIFDACPSFVIGPAHFWKIPKQ